MNAGLGIGTARRTSHYIGSHWRGEQSLFRSFWINLVSLRALIFVLQAHWSPFATPDDMPLVVALLLVVHGVVFLWQIVGTLRAAERDLVASGSQAPAWGAQLGAVVLCFLTFAHVIEGWQLTRAIPDVERFDERMERERQARYTIRIDADQHELILSGTIELGVTRRVAARLRERPSIVRIRLDSDGGNVYEARGLARLMRENALAAHVDGRCASACTIAFIGGDPRTISRTGKLGFHQYRLADGRQPYLPDPREAQRRDQDLFTRAGVSTGFVNRLFSVAPDDMWWPTNAELRAAGVVDQVTRD